MSKPSKFPYRWTFCFSQVRFQDAESVQRAMEMFSDYEGHPLTLKARLKGGSQGDFMVIFWENGDFMVIDRDFPGISHDLSNENGDW